MVNNFPFKISHILFVLCLFPFTLQNSLAQDFNEIHRKIKTATENREYQTAIAELDALKKADQKTYELNNYDYLLARLAEKQGDAATAAANYETVARRGSVLTEYALWHLAQIYRASGNILLERIYLQKLAAVAPESLLLNAANKRLPNSYFESKDYDAVIQLLSGQKQIGAANPKSETNQKSKTENRETMALLGRAYRQNGKTGEAAQIFTKLVEDLPNAGQPDDFALVAAKILDETANGAANADQSVLPLTDYGHLRRAQIYQFNRDFPRSRRHFQAIVVNHPASGLVPDALFQIGRGYAQEKNYDEAINWFERVRAEFPAHPVAADALSQTAAAYARVNKPKEAVARYQKFIEQYQNAETLDRAYLNIIDVLRDTGANSDALKWTAKTREAFRGKTPEAIALFAQARIRLAQNDFENALNDLNNLRNLPDLGGMRAPGGTNEAEIVFLKGFALENLRRFSEAIDVYLSIPDGRNEYYGWRATERLKALANNEAAKNTVAQKIIELTKNIEARNAEAQRKAAQNVLRLSENAELRAEMLEIVKKAYASLPDYQKIPNGKILELGRREVLKTEREKPTGDYHQTIADELLFLSLYDEAAPEMGNSQQSTVNSNQKTETAQNPKSQIPNPKSDYDYTLAVFYKRGEHANRAVAYAEPLWRKIPADYQIELMPREQIELLYPAPYTDALLKYAPERAVDPRLLLAIMRQESRFRPDVKSYAAARGLMQFISPTADVIAGELRLENFSQDELYQPPTAILFGSQYLSNLFKLFPNQPAAVAASYNGGEDNIARWLARAKSDDLDRYVPEIIFTQSKDYVYKVLAAYRVYRTIHDENLRAK